MIDWAYINTKRAVYEKRYTRKMLTALRRTILPFITAIKTMDGNLIDLNAIITDEHVKGVYRDLYMTVGKVFIKDLTNVMQKNDFQERLWEIEMERYITDVAGSKITLVTNYTKESIRQELKKVMQQGMNEGLSIFEIMKNLRTDLTKGYYSTFTKARALRIVKTEVMTASNQGSITAANLSGYASKKSWVTSPEGVAKKERHNAMNMNGQTVLIHDYFDVGGVRMMYPGDPDGGAENVINCNCTLTYQV
jgi:hypothetical protein